MYSLMETRVILNVEVSLVELVVEEEEVLEVVLEVVVENHHKILSDHNQRREEGEVPKR